MKVAMPFWGASRAIMPTTGPSWGSPSSARIRPVPRIALACISTPLGMVMILSATDGESALAHVAECDVALISTDLGSSESVGLLRSIREITPTTKVLVLGLTESQEQVLPYIQAGAFGYVLADESVDDLLTKVRTAYEDRALISPGIAAAQSIVRNGFVDGSSS